MRPLERVYIGPPGPAFEKARAELMVRVHALNADLQAAGKPFRVQTRVVEYKTQKKLRVGLYTREVQDKTRGVR